PSIFTLSLHDALPISIYALAACLTYFLVSPVSLSLTACYAQVPRGRGDHAADIGGHTDHLEALAYTFSRGFSTATENTGDNAIRSEEHTSELQSLAYL